MKKFMTLLTVLFVFTLTLFSQDNMVKTTKFHLFDGTNYHETGFTVSVNPTYPTMIEEGGLMTILFHDVLDFTGIDGNVSMDFTTPITKLSLQNGAVYGVKFNYNSIVSGNVYINYNPNTEFVFLTEQDTIDAYNNGVTKGFYDGVTSVDTSIIFNNGYNFGFVEGENNLDEAVENAYQDGYTDGENGTSTGIYDNIAVTGLNVYPNPADVSETITVTCDNFNNVRVYSMTGSLVYSPTSNTFSIGDFNGVSGVYVLRVEDNDFNVTNTRLIVQ